MNRLRQLKKSDWIAIALTGVLILIIAMPLSPKQSDSESTAEQETAAAVLDSGSTQDSQCICGCDGKEAEACAWADGGGRRDRGDDHAIRFR